MNKQKLIETLEEIKANIDRNAETSDYTDFSRGRKDAYNNVIGLAKQLDEPKKVVVPKFVAIELDKLKDKYLTLRELYAGDVNWLNDGTFYLEGKELELAGWVNKNETTFEYAWLHGYEVEKEQLYYVDFINDGDVHKLLILDHENGKHNIVDWSDNLIGLVQEIFTEQEIKAIDERYWPFAVKVDGE